MPGGAPPFAALKPPEAPPAPAALRAACRLLCRRPLAAAAALAPLPEQRGKLTTNNTQEQANWRAKYDLGFNLLCDPSKSTLKALGILSADKIVRSHIVVAKGGAVLDARCAVLAFFGACGLFLSPGPARLRAGRWRRDGARACPCSAVLCFALVALLRALAVLDRGRRRDQTACLTLAILSLSLSLSCPPSPLNPFGPKPSSYGISPGDSFTEALKTAQANKQK